MNTKNLVYFFSVICIISMVCPSFAMYKVLQKLPGALNKTNLAQNTLSKFNSTNTTSLLTKQLSKSNNLKAHIKVDENFIQSLRNNPHDELADAAIKELTHHNNDLKNQLVDTKKIIEKRNFWKYALYTGTVFFGGCAGSAAALGAIVLNDIASIFH